MVSIFIILLLVLAAKGDNIEKFLPAFRWELLLLLAFHHFLQQLLVEVDLLGTNFKHAIGVIKLLLTWTNTPLLYIWFKWALYCLEDILLVLLRLNAPSPVLAPFGVLLVEMVSFSLTALPVLFEHWSVLLLVLFIMRGGSSLSTRFPRFKIHWNS